ncbi:hypothetical protein NL676_013410 [Syzygium grande]|nr:hypothetical protein NL676_013410 [Syzygium grande]
MEGARGHDSGEGVAAARGLAPGGDPRPLGGFSRSVGVVMATVHEPPVPVQNQRFRFRTVRFRANSGPVSGRNYPYSGLI